MRIWDLPCHNLCNKHLLGEHRELHAIFIYITTDKGKSYRKHPETLRWVNKLTALAERHNEQVKEIIKRGWNHNSSIEWPIYPHQIQSNYVNTLEEQIEILKKKGCECHI